MSPSYLVDRTDASGHAEMIRIAPKGSRRPPPSRAPAEPRDSRIPIEIVREQGQGPLCAERPQWPERAGAPWILRAKVYPPIERGIR